MYKKEKGITLIALVITIIVLIILAAVTLGVLTGDNGIITRAIQSRESTGTQQEAEFVNLITSKIRIEEKTGETVTQEDLQGYIDEVFGINNATGSISEGNYIIEVIGGATYTITSIGVQKQGEIKIVDSTQISRGVFVKYDVAYDDIYSDKSYSTTNGWRLVDYTYNTETGKYDNVKLISTGVPVNMYYHYNQTSNSSWWESNSSEISQYRNILNTTITNGGTYSLPSSDSNNIKFSLGLYKSNKFETTEYKYDGLWGNSESNYINRGYFKSVTNGIGANAQTYDSTTTSAISAASLFKVNNENIRILTLAEVNAILGRTDNDSVQTISAEEENSLGAQAKGLFDMNNIKDLKNMNEYTYSTSNYWLASPQPGNDSIYSVVNIYSGGGITGAGWSLHSWGLRPSVILGNGIFFTDNNNDGVLEYNR